MKQKKKVAIQGGYGAFHDLAAIEYFGRDKVEVVPKTTFNDVFKTLHDFRADYGILAIENSIAGSILPNYALLRESGMHITGEIYLRIQQNLLAMPGQSIDDLREVYSHPMAILQCHKFFDHYPHIRLIDSADTALAAKKISEQQLQGIGAIASEYAAEKYGLEILVRGIEVNDMNYTRFLIVGHENTIPKSKVNKASIHFALAHKIGSLVKILSILSFYEINLSKIQSLPIVGRDWEYQFYTDLEFDDYDRYRKSLDAIRPFTSELGLLGEYVKGKSVI